MTINKKIFSITVASIIALSGAKSEAATISNYLNHIKPLNDIFDKNFKGEWGHNFLQNYNLTDHIIKNLINWRGATDSKIKSNNLASIFTYLTKQYSTLDKKNAGIAVAENADPKAKIEVDAKIEAESHLAEAEASIVQHYNREPSESTSSAINAAENNKVGGNLNLEASSNAEQQNTTINSNNERNAIATTHKDAEAKTNRSAVDSTEENITEEATATTSEMASQNVESSQNHNPSMAVLAGVPLAINTGIMPIGVVSAPIIEVAPNNSVSTLAPQNNDKADNNVKKRIVRRYFGFAIQGGDLLYKDGVAGLLSGIGPTFRLGVEVTNKHFYFGYELGAYLPFAPTRKGIIESSEGNFVFFKTSPFMTGSFSIFVEPIMLKLGVSMASNKFQLYSIVGVSILVVEKLWISGTQIMPMLTAGFGAKLAIGKRTSLFAELKGDMVNYELRHPMAFVRGSLGLDFTI